MGNQWVKSATIAAADPHANVRFAAPDAIKLLETLNLGRGTTQREACMTAENDTGDTESDTAFLSLTL